MELRRGRLAGAIAHPATRKFSRPIVLLPELFTTISHLSLLSGYLNDLGWEVCTLDPYSALGADCGVAALTALVREALGACEGNPILVGHGYGGWLGLQLAPELSTVAIGLGPALPGFRSPLIAGWRRRLALKLGTPLAPPTGRTLFEFIADAEAFQREQIIRGLTRHFAGFAAELERQAESRDAPATLSPPAAAAPSGLIIAGDSDIFAPRDRVARFALAIGAEVRWLGGRGHWLVGGRALERTVSEMQRFIVRALGQELLLLYSEPPEDQGA